jgi:hypothetical protein
MTTFAVITPTVGSQYLGECIESLKGQDCKHYIVVDGEKHLAPAQHIMRQHTHENLRLIFLQENVGKAGGDWYGHRVYAAASFLVNEDVLCYLDEDNYVNGYYIRAFEYSLHNHQWAYTLRNIVSKDGEFVCPDNCESLGKWPIYGNEANGHHIDTSCFAVPRSIAVQIGHAWYGQYAADRQFFQNLKHHFPNFACTMKHTLNYRLDGNPKSVKKEFFEAGNVETEKLYGEQFPWHEVIQSF